MLYINPLSIVLRGSCLTKSYGWMTFDRCRYIKYSHIDSKEAEKILVSKQKR